ncbi:MAG: type II secretion system F family protein [Armatimonadota bacterium]|nr:type II secretion system F family protein [Armatimonadota bacterium]
MFIAIVTVTFGFAFFLVLGITMKTERELIRERVDKYSMVGEVLSSPLHAEFAGSFSDRVIRPLLRKVSALARAVTPRGQVEGIDAKLETAGRPLKWGVAEFMGLKTITIVVFAVLGYYSWRYLRVDRPLLSIAAGLLVFVVGYFLPEYLLQHVIYQRQSRIRKALPDTIDLLTVSVEAGVGFDGAMARVAEKVKGPLTDELLRALEEIRLGKTRMQALRDMSVRVALPEMSTFVAALYQAEQLGVSIAKVLRVQGETMRTRRSQMARELAAKLPVKMVFPLVFFIFPSIFVVLLGPALMEIYRTLK